MEFLNYYPNCNLVAPKGYRASDPVVEKINVEIFVDRPDHNKFLKRDFNSHHCKYEYYEVKDSSLVGDLVVARDPSYIHNRVIGPKKT